jgi:hypothetical protein
MNVCEERTLNILMNHGTYKHACVNDKIQSRVHALVKVIRTRKTKNEVDVLVLLMNGNTPTCDGGTLLSGMTIHNR